VRILVIEDHTLVREGLVRLLEEVLPEAEVRAVAGAEEALPHLDWAERVLLDLSLPGKPGLAFLAELAESHPDLPVVVLTAYDEPAFRARAEELGASAFLSKNDPPERLVEALRGLASIEAPSPDRLSPTERTVLLLLGQGLSNAEVAERLGIEEKTVYTHRRHLMYKLGIKNASELIRFAALYHTGLDGKKNS